jgi:hypothetical protein
MGAADLNSRSQRDLTFQKIKFGPWGSSKFEFRPIELFQYRGVCGLNSAAETGEGHSVLSVGVMHM